MRVSNRLLKVMSRGGYEPQTATGLAEKLQGQGVRVGDVTKALAVLEDEGRVIRVDGEKYALPERLDLVVGDMQANREGFGFVSTPLGDIFVSGKYMNGAMHSDRVALGLMKRKRYGLAPEGEVAKVLERGMTSFVGRFFKRAKMAYAVPSDRRVLYDFLVAPAERQGAVEGDLVACEITAYPEQGRLPQARVVEVLGPEDAPGVEIEAIIREHGLSTVWAQAAVDEVEALPADVPEEELERRKDYRGEFIVTIDGLDARDFDDAVWAVKRDDGGFDLAVHIADVSHFVAVESAVDAEAEARGTSVYLPDRVIPMLPTRVSNDLGSLNPGVDRLTFSVEMKIDPKGNVYDFMTTLGVIRSKRRLTYEEVDECFSSGRFPDGETESLLLVLRDLSDVLEAKRMRRGALDFETVEAKIVLDGQGYAQDVVLRARTAATKLIEETMIVTNETVARYMYEQEAPMIYRTHDKPDMQSVALVEQMVEELGYKLPPVQASDAKSLQRLIDFVKERPEKLLINSLLLRAMKQARYAAACSPHFGLASSHYTHFTSPIRRYPDLIVHRMLKAVLDGAPMSAEVVALSERLGELAELCSGREREAEAAEREAVQVMLCELMKKQIGEVFDGIITGVANYGFFVAIPNSAEGLVHRRHLEDDFYTYLPERFSLVGRKRGKTYRLGQEIKVRLVNVTVGERQIDFVPADSDVGL